MKSVIVTCAVLIIILIFPLQYALEQTNHYNISQLQKCVNISKEKAKIKGYFTPDIINELRANITNSIDGVEDSDIIIDVTTTPQYRTDTFDDRELIHYRIGIPIKKIIVANAFWGISDAENTTNYVIENYTTSELLP